MTIDEKLARGSIATMVATAAVTLAIGVTAAALGGYLVPNEGGGAAETAPTPQPAAPNVVLVPVAPDSARLPPAPVPRQPEPVFAAYEPDERDEDEDSEDHHGRRGHQERRHEDDHEDHD